MFNQLLIHSIILFNSLGYTPVEEAKTAGNNQIVDEIEKFKNNIPEESKENKRSIHTEEPQTDKNGDNLQSTVSELSERVNFLESLLTEVSKIGDTLKTESLIASNSDNPETLKELGEKLSAMRPTGSINQGSCVSKSVAIHEKIFKSIIGESRKIAL